MANFDVLIKNGTVARGGKMERLDVGIKDDKIKDLGDLSGAEAEVLIDASEKYVAPGFVDLTNHSDTHWTLFSAPSQESLLGQGITTILGGNCGSSLAPLVKAEDIAGIQKWVDIRKINFNWRRVSEFFEELSRHSLGVNFATLVGHGTLRRGILGDEPRAASPDELEGMKLLLKESLKEGAFGLSTNLGAAHGRPAGEEELAELFGVAAKAGVFTKHHLKDEGKNILPALGEILNLGRRSGAKIALSHFKFLGRGSWNYFHDAINMIDYAREEGLEVGVDIFPYTRTGSQLYQLLPPWVLEEGSGRKILEKIKNEAQRQDLIAYLKTLTLHYERITIASTLNDRLSVGKTLETLSGSSGIPPEEFILEILESNELKVSIFNEAISEAHLEALIKKEYCSLASDGVGYSMDSRSDFDLPHPRSYGSYPRAFEIFAQGKKVLPWGELIYKMSELPAKTLGLRGRGRIEKGFFADITVFDPGIIESPAEYDNPYYGPRGIEWVLVNGKIALERDNFTGINSGKIIKSND